MIRVTCPTCGSTFDTADANAGRKAKCSNCQGAITIPASAQASPGQAPAHVQTAAVGAPAGTGVNPAGPTVVVQVPGAPIGSTLGPANKSVLLAVLFWFIPVPGLPYFYLGQVGKGLVEGLLIEVCFFGFLAVLGTLLCGIGLLFVLPVLFLWRILVLIDVIVVAGRTKHGPIHPWRCF